MVLVWIDGFYWLVLLLFLLMIFLGTDGDAELRWWRSATDGDATMGVGVGTDETFGDCRALAQLAITTGTLEVGPALEDRPSSPLLLFPVSILQTIKQDVSDNITSVRLNWIRTKRKKGCSWIVVTYSVHTTTAAEGVFVFVLFFPCVRYPTFQSTTPHHASLPAWLLARSARCTTCGRRTEEKWRNNIKRVVYMSVEYDDFIHLLGMSLISKLTIKLLKLTPAFCWIFFYVAKIILLLNRTDI